MRPVLLLGPVAFPVAFGAAAQGSEPDPEQGRFVALEPVRGDVIVSAGGADTARP